MPSLLERFLRYVRYDTQSREGASTYPSTEGQLVLLGALANELRELCAADVQIDSHGYVTATVPGTSEKRAVPAIGFIAHVDTSPEMPGANVRPIVHARYDGRDILFPDGPGLVLRPNDDSALAERVGDDIVTASGDTLLGADNKAGIAVVMTAVEYLLARPEIPHGPVRVAFTPDEEVGAGTRFFDVPGFGATAAYTMDGGRRGELEYESFSADAMTVTFHGFNTHPGYAKDVMVNGLRGAADFIGRLPRQASPERTSGYEGFVHPYTVSGGVEAATVRLIVRDFNTGELKRRVALVTGAGAPDGIGMASARLLAQMGAAVAVAATTDRIHDRARELGAHLSTALQRLSREESATLFMTLLAAFNLVLSRLTGQEDVVVGTPIAGRDRAAARLQAGDAAVGDVDTRDLAALDRVAMALDEAAFVAKRNADEQEQISLA